MATMLKPTNMNNWRVVVKARKGQKLLGHLLWYTIGELLLDRDQLEEAFVRSGVDLSRIPTIQPNHAFQRATANCERLRLPNDDGTFTNLLVRSIRDNHQEVIRMLVEEQVDAANQRLGYQPVARMMWSEDDLDLATIQPEPGALLSDRSLEVLDGLQSAFDDAKRQYTGRAIRAMVTDLLANGQPVSVRRAGGVYFVPFAHNTVTRQVKELVEALRETAKNDGTAAYMVAVANQPDQKVMVRREASHDIGREVAAVTEKIMTWLGENKRVSAPMAKNAMTEVMRLQERVSEYEQLLEDNLGDLKERTNQAKLLLTNVFRNKLDV